MLKTDKARERNPDLSKWPNDVGICYHVLVITTDAARNQNAAAISLRRLDKCQ